MDERTMEIWFHKIGKPYVEGHANGQKSLLLLGEMKCHIQQSFCQTKDLPIAHTDALALP